MVLTRSIGLCGAVLLLLVQASVHAQRAQAPPTQQSTATTTLPRGDIEHGRYLVERVAMCAECHSGRDAQGNIVASQRFVGGPIPLAQPVLNWVTAAPRNKGLPGYSDELALRLLTQGSIGRSGEQLRPPMPRFRMTVQDAADVIAYMRSLQ